MTCSYSGWETYAIVVTVMFITATALAFLFFLIAQSQGAELLRQHDYKTRPSNNQRSSNGQAEE